LMDARKHRIPAEVRRKGKFSLDARLDDLTVTQWMINFLTQK
jgi:hypothetical protein